MTPPHELKVGTSYAHPYPFLRSTHTEMDEEGSWERPCWRPGVILKFPGHEARADGIGEQCLTIISLHRPGKYAERVFYTQSWIDPEGKPFGSGKLRLCTVQKFCRLICGYRYPYSLES